MKKQILVLAVFIMIFQQTRSQENLKGWEKWQYLTGEWVGEGSGQPGSGSGSFTVKPKLGGCILERKGKAVIQASAGKPEALHEDVTIIYKNMDGIPDRAIYFDNENHVINYSITYPDNKIVFLSEANPSAPRFRLVYEKLDDKAVVIRFEMAMPGAPDQFRTYLEGKNRKVKELTAMTP